jgi:hypothetical protein
MKTKSVPMQKLTMMKQSIGCMALGLAGMLPVIGICCAIIAFYLSYAARQKEKLFWNPARPHRIIGLVSAAFGALVWGGVDTIVIFRILNPNT